MSVIPATQSELRLEMHVSHACNLTCESCSHYSNSGHQGFVSVQEADSWMKAWCGRLRPTTFVLLGGEPTLNPELPAMVRLARDHWPNSKILVITNGFFLHKHPTLPRVLEETRAGMLVTIHHDSPVYQQKVKEILSLLRVWQSVHRFAAQIEESSRRWTRRYKGHGATMLPFEDDDARASWEHCIARSCRQLFRGRLWKCSPIAYLQLQKERYPALSSQWDRYLGYLPLGPTCSDEQLDQFLRREEEEICTMCAASPEPFTKPDPLIPLGILARRARAH